MSALCPPYVRLISVRAQTLSIVLHRPSSALVLEWEQGTEPQVSPMYTSTCWGAVSMLKLHL